MSEYHFPIPGGLEEEKIVLFIRRHWAAYLGQFVVSLLVWLIPIAIVIAVYVAHLNTRFFQGIALNFVILILSAYYMVAAMFIFMTWMSFYYSMYIVTRDEIIEITQTGFLGRKIAQLSILRVQDVTSSIKGLGPTLFSFGDVLVETAAEQENFLLESIPNPQEVSSRIMSLHDEVVAREGRHQELSEGEGVLRPSSISYQEFLKRDRQKEPPKMEEESHDELQTRGNNTEEKVEESPEEIDKEGEISKDDLDKGGEINIK
jgi:membrane protein YdbS with pleckstrin-like domain